MVNELNNYRRRCFSVDSPARDKIMQRLSELETVIARLNRGGGIGFVIFGIVIDQQRPKAALTAIVVIAPMTRMQHAEPALTSSTIANEVVGMLMNMTSCFNTTL